MKNDYLWDRSGEPDPELEKLEASLGRFRTEASELDLSRMARAAASERRSGWPMPRLASAALLAAACAAALALLLRPVSRPPGPGWDVERLAGAPQVGRAALPANGGKGR